MSSRSAYLSRPWPLLGLLPVALGACTGADDPSAQPTCPAGEIADGDVCVPDACGVGAWGSLALDEGTVYVQAGARGDGTESSPLGSIQDGADLAGARGGGLVAIAAGTYVENVVLGEAHRGVTLAGRCREQVVVDGRDGEGQATLLVQGERRPVEIGLRDLRIQGGPLGGLAFAVARADVLRVDVVDNARAGVMVYDADVRMEGSRVTGTVVGGGSRVGAGVEVQIGALELVDSLVRGNADEGIHAQGPQSRATLTGVEVRDNGAFGVDVLDAADVTVASSVIAGNTVGDVVIDGDGTTLDMTDTVVSGTRAEAGRVVGVTLRNGATGSLTRVTVDGPWGNGLLVDGQGTNVTVADLTLQGNLGTGAGDPDDGHGMVVRGGAVVTGAGVRAEGNSGVGLGAEGSLLELVGAEVLANGGRGADVIGGGVLALTDSRLADNVQVGVFVDETGSRAELRGTTVEGTVRDAEGGFGHGVIVRDGASLLAESSSFSGNTRAACFLEGEGAEADLVEVALDATLPDDWGTGASLVLNDGAVARIRGGSARDARYAAIGVIGAGSRLEAEGLRVEDVGMSVSGRGGYGIVADAGGEALLTDVDIVRAAAHGLIAQGSRTRVVVRDSRVVDTLQNRTTRVAAGVVAQLSARVELAGSTVSGTAGPGAVAVADGELDVRESLFDSNVFAGIVMLGPALVDLEDVTVLAAADATSGVGVYGMAGRLRAAGLEVGPHPHAALWLDGPGVYLVSDSDLSGSEGVGIGGATMNGNAVYARGGVTAWDGSLGLWLARNHVHGAAGPAVLLDGASATLEGNSWEDNAVEVWQQRCDSAAPLVDPVAAWTVCDGGNLLVDTALAFPRFDVGGVELEEP